MSGLPTSGDGSNPRAVYSNIENPTAISGQRQQARPESLAVGDWNNGMLRYWVWQNETYFNIDATDQKLKSGQHPHFSIV
jgi:hypothetical protein